MVPQDITIFSGTLVDNILLDDDISKAKEVIDFCRHSGFHSFFEDFPQSYATILGESGVALSGGQKQLVALARCLYHQPQLLLLDEPTAAMDKYTEQFVINVLSSLKKQTGILLISHRDSLTKIADRIYNLEKGSLRVVSNHEDDLRHLYEMI